MIYHDTEPKVHRVVFKSKSIEGKISVHYTIFSKIKSKMEKWNNDNPLNFWKNSNYTLGLSKHGKIVLYVKSDLSVFPKEFLRSLRQDFNFNEIEIHTFIRHLEFVELEISHKITDPLEKLKNAKIHYDIEGLVNKLIAFTDESFGSLELEIKGDPSTSGNLEFLLRDKLNAVLYFAELTKIVAKLTKIQDEIQNTLSFVRNGVVFLIDDLLNNRLVFTKQNNENEDDK
ncbi:hypothetical protein ES702_02974 [subsurface metagenome]